MSAWQSEQGNIPSENGGGGTKNFGNSYSFAEVADALSSSGCLAESLLSAGGHDSRMAVSMTGVRRAMDFKEMLIRYSPCCKKNAQSIPWPGLRTGKITEKYLKGLQLRYTENIFIQIKKF
jgi:hypothetical protein